MANYSGEERSTSLYKAGWGAKLLGCVSGNATCSRLEKMYLYNVFACLWNITSLLWDILENWIQPVMKSTGYPPKKGDGTHMLYPPLLPRQKCKAQ